MSQCCRAPMPCPTIRDATSRYIDAAPDLARSTAQKMRFEARRFERFMHSPPPREVSNEMIAAFRGRAMQAGLSPRSIEDSIATVRLVIRSLGLHAPDVGRKLRQRLTPPAPATLEELRQLWDAADSMSWPETETWMLPSAWWRAWMTLAYWTGLRLTNLTWGLSLEHWGQDAIRYVAGKTGVRHVFPMTERLSWIVAQCKERRPRTSILHCAHHATRLRTHLTKLCDAAGIRRLTPKNLRQASITQWTKAASRAGEIIHGCGMPTVLAHYLDPLEILQEAAPRVAWPFPEHSAAAAPRQLTLF